MTPFAIVGGGPAGCATALSLLAAGVPARDIVLIEGSTYARERIGESIPPDTRQLFDQLGVLQEFLAEGHAPCAGSAASWGGPQMGCNDYLFNPYGHGWHLDRRRFDAWMAEQVRARGVQFHTGLRVLRTERRQDSVRLHLGLRGKISSELSAGFVVDATGKKAHIATAMGATSERLDELVSVSGVFRFPDGVPFPSLTLLEAVEDGWWYLARLPRRRVAVAFATSREIFRAERLAQPRPWLLSLMRTRHLFEVLKRCEPEPDSMAVSAAPSYRLQTAVGDRWLAVGDAASAFDPISAQGIYKALQDGVRAGRALARGDRVALSEYDQAVRERFATYTDQRAYFYEREQRWPQSPFWAGRQERGVSAV